MSFINLQKKQIIELFKFQKIFLVKIIYKIFHNFAFKFEIEFLLKDRIRFLVSPRCELNFGNQLCVFVFHPQNFTPNFSDFILKFYFPLLKLL